MNKNKTSFHCTGRYELNKLTWLPMCGLIAQLVAPISRRSRFESRWSPDIFQASSFQLLKLENLLRWSLFTFIYNCSTIWISYIFHKNKTFARPSRAVIISVHFFPVLGKSATWNDHYSNYKENRNTQARIWIFFPSLDTAPLNSVWVVLLGFESHTNWDNDKKD